MAKLNTKTNSADCRIKIPLLPLFLCVAYKISVRGKSGILLNLSHVLWHYRAFTPSSPCRVPQHCGEFRSNKKSSNKEKRKPTKADRSVTFNLLPLCSCKEYRGSARRSRGLKPAIKKLLCNLLNPSVKKRGVP